MNAPNLPSIFSNSSSPTSPVPSMSACSAPPQMASALPTPTWI
jgi:hypothetical protein